MGMHVANCLTAFAARVEHHTIPGLDSEIGGCTRQGRQNSTSEGRVVGRERADVVEVLAGNGQQMYRGSRMKVAKDHDVVSGGYDFSGYLARSY